MAADTDAGGTPAAPNEPEQTREEGLAEALEGAIGVTEDEAGNVIEPAAPAEPAQPAADPAKPAEPVAAAPTEPVDPAKAAADKAAAEREELYRPLPENNPRKTQERFQKLVEVAKTAEAKLQEYEPIVAKARDLEQRLANSDQGWKAIREMGFQDEEGASALVEFSNYRAALASGNFEAARASLQREAQQLALLSGKPFEVDAFAAFPDLRQGIQDGKVDPNTALELARRRQQDAQQQQRQTRQQQANNETEQQQRVRHEGAKAVDVVVQGLMKDPDFAKVEPALMAQLDDIRANYSPNQWAREIKRAYDTEAKILRLQAAQVAGRTTSTPTPLRNSGQAGGRPAPASMADAVMQELGLQ